MEFNFATDRPETLRYELSFDGRPYVVRVEHKDDLKPGQSRSIVAGGRALPDRDECIIACFNCTLCDVGDNDKRERLTSEILTLALYHMPSQMTEDQSADLRAVIDQWVTERWRAASLPAREE